MLSNKIRKRIKEHKWTEHSNQSQFFNRLKGQSITAIKDLTLIAKEFDEAQLKQIFNEDTMRPLISAIMRPPVSKRKSDDVDKRIFMLGFFLIRLSLSTTRDTLHDYWAEQLFSQYVTPLQNMLMILYKERSTRNLEENF